MKKDLEIIIPCRLSAKRLPNKPLKKINNKEMILHVYENAIKASLGNVSIATPDKQIHEFLINKGIKCFMTSNKHKNGTDRVYEVFSNYFKEEPNYIINLQGDMPFINKEILQSIASYLKKDNCDICTIAGKIDHTEINNKDIVKVETLAEISKDNFSRAQDFFRIRENADVKKIYHHIGVYGFTKKAITKYINLKPTKSEVDRSLEQMRALDNQMKIEVGYTNSIPLSVDTEADLDKITKLNTYE